MKIISKGKPANQIKSVRADSKSADHYPLSLTSKSAGKGTKNILAPNGEISVRRNAQQVQE